MLRAAKEEGRGGEGKGGGIGRKGFLGVGRNAEERKENSVLGNGNGKWEHHPCLHPSAVGRQPSGTALPGPKVGIVPAANGANGGDGRCDRKQRGVSLKFPSTSDV